MAIQEIFSVSAPSTGSILNARDENLVKTYQLNSSFNTVEDRAEIHIYTLTNTLLFSDTDYRLYRVSPNRFTEGSNIDAVEIDPVSDAKAYGYSSGDVRIDYLFLRQIGTVNKKEPEFFIKNISPDRSELLLDSIELETNQIEEIAQNISELISDEALVQSIVLNFKDNNFATIVNSKRFDNGLAIKLYSPLPQFIELKDTLTINNIVGDPVSFTVTKEVIETPDKLPALKGPNFSIDLNDTSNPTEYLTSLQLLQTITSSVYEPYSLANRLGIDLSIDYSDYTNFIHFSSVEERLRNFKYKLDTLAGYHTSRSLAENIFPTSQASSSMDRYDALIAGIVNNFDHYDRHLYFQSGSTSWPKSNTTKPYNNLPSSHASASAFFNDQINSASLFDEKNEHRLINSIPSFLKEDSNNTPYNLFVDMIGQHFDNLWIYSKAIGDRYDADNRLDRGISKELVGEALRSFGTKIYSNNSSFDSLFSMFVGEFYQTGSETVNTFVTASNNPTNISDYQKGVYKRLYHNTPLLLKSKGTERGIKALFTSFGIPTDLLSIKYTGGIKDDTQLYYGPGNLYTSSLSRIRLDNTGSIVSGSTLSYNTSVVRENSNYTQDLHTVQVGFSPADYINEYIISQSLMPGSFNVDNYIGDPRAAYSSSYQLMNKVVEDNIGGSFEQYDIKDLVRLVKFYDNSFFKMLKDFLPARTNLTSGIVVKPTIFHRSKVKQVRPTTTEHYYSGSTPTVSISGNHGRSFKNYNTAFSYLVPLPSGSFGLKQSFNEARFTGELSGSELTVVTGELNSDNTFKKPNTDVFNFHIRPLLLTTSNSLPDNVFGLTISVTGYTP